MEQCPAKAKQSFRTVLVRIVKRLYVIGFVWTADELFVGIFICLFALLFAF